MKDVEITKGKNVSNKDFKSVIQNVIELLNSQEDGKEKAIEYLNTFIDEK